MSLIIDGNTLPPFKRMKIANDDAMAKNRGQSGQLNIDRSYKKDTYQFEFDFFDLGDYNVIKTLYERQFTEGTFFRLQNTDTGIPLDTYVFIEPQNIVPRFKGTTIEGYTLELTQR